MMYLPIREKNVLQKVWDALCLKLLSSALQVLRFGWCSLVTVCASVITWLRHGEKSV